MTPKVASFFVTLEPIILWLVRSLFEAKQGEKLTPEKRQEFKNAFQKAVAERDPYYLEKFLSPDREHPTQ